MAAWAKRYSSITFDEIRSMRPEEYKEYCEHLSDLIRRESGSGDSGDGI